MPGPASGRSISGLDRSADLDVGGASTDDIYAAMALFDVSSSWLEGSQCPLEHLATLK